MRRCTTHALYRSKLWQQDYCQHPQNANLDCHEEQGRAQGDKNQVSGYGYGLWCAIKWGPHHATSHLQSRLESQHQSVPGSAEECSDPMVQSGGQVWLQKECYDFVAFSHWPPPPPTWTCWTTSFGHTSRMSPTSPKYMYIGKIKRKGQPYHTNWKTSTDTQSIGQKKKPP